MLTPENSSGQSFVRFYNENGIIPVRQDINDKGEFYAKRNFLYSSLGVPLSMLKDRSVLEFGPGGGWNAVATSAHQPSNYVFVDGAVASVAELRKKLSNKLFKAKNTEIYESNIYSFSDPRKFDLVIAEGLIPGQKDPGVVLRKVSSFVGDTGSLIVTTTTSASLLSEFCRRLFSIRLFEGINSFADKVKVSANFFESHLKSLGTKTRPIEDWVADSIVHEWHKEQMVFSLEDCIAEIGEQFSFYGSLPRFLIDDRWYKLVERKSNLLNEMALDQHKSISASFLDYRVPLRVALQSGVGGDVENICTELRALHDQMMFDGSYNRLYEFSKGINELAGALPGTFKSTVTALREFNNLFPRFAEGEPVDFKHFPNWWGRGQQYVSFTRNFGII